MHRVDAARRGAHLLGVAEDDREHRAERAQQSPVAVASPLAVLVDAPRDERVCDLHEQRAPTADEDHRLAVDLADGRIG